MTDSLYIDQAQVAQWQADSRYDYDRELVGGSQSLLEYLSERLSRWLSQTLDTTFDNRLVYWGLIVLGAVVVGIVAWLVWRRRAGLFMREEKAGGLNYTVTPDTIYGIDFDVDLAQAEADGDWRQCVRLVYLQTLRRLSDAGCIDWQPSKTPAQYEREVGQQAFTALSRHFVRVRYGNFEATSDLYDTMRRLQTDVKAEKGGGDAE